MELVNQAFELFIQALRFVYDWTLGLIAQALGMAPASLPIWKLLIWVILLVFLIYAIFWLIRALWEYFRSVWHWGYFAAMVVLAAIMLYVPDSFLGLP